MTFHRQRCFAVVVIAVASAACAARGRGRGAAAGAAAAPPCEAPPAEPPDSLTLTGADGTYALTLVATGAGARREAVGTLTLTGTDSGWSYLLAHDRAPVPDSLRRLGTRRFGGVAAVPLAAVGVAWPGTRPAGAGPDSLIADGHELRCAVRGTCGRRPKPTMLGVLLRPPVRRDEPQVSGPAEHGDARWPRLVPTRRDAAGFAGRWTGGGLLPGRASGYFCAVRRPAAATVRETGGPGAAGYADVAALRRVAAKLAALLPPAGA